MGITYDLFDSGLVSSIVFLIGMLIYDAANLYELGVLRPDAPDRWKNTAWINFWGAIAFVLESLSDVIWFTDKTSCYKKMGKERRISGCSINDPLLSKDRDLVSTMSVQSTQRRNPIHSIVSTRSIRGGRVFSQCSTTGLLLDEGEPNGLKTRITSANALILNEFKIEDVLNPKYSKAITASGSLDMISTTSLRPITRSRRSTFGKRRAGTSAGTTINTSEKTSWLDKIRWNLWSAVFFLIPSLFYLVQCLIDPYTMYCPWFVSLLDKWRVSDNQYLNTTNALAAYLFTFDSLINLMAWYTYIRRQDDVDWTFADWLFWADVFFVIASLFMVYNLYDLRKEVGIMSNGFWTLDALFYVIGSSRALQETRKLAQAEEKCQSFHTLQTSLGYFATA